VNLVESILCGFSLRLFFAPLLEVIDEEPSVSRKGARTQSFAKKNHDPTV
jgi:hypothetical protein